MADNAQGPHLRPGWPGPRGGQSGGMNARQVDLVLRDLDGLPVLPAVLSRALELTAAPPAERPGQAAGLDEVAAIVRADPALTARILCLANAVPGGAAAATARQALRQLGMESLRATLLAAKPLLPFPASDPGNGLDLLEFHRHCLAVAAASRLLVERAAMPLDPEEAFAAGLLHDIGKLAFALLLPKSHARAVAAARLHHGCLAEYEALLIGLDHAGAGRRLAQRWRLPASLESVIWLHHMPAEALPPSLPAGPLVHVVSLADSLARSFRLGASGSYDPAHGVEALIAKLGLPASLVSEIGEALGEQVDRLVRLLGLDRPQSRGDSAALAGAAQELGRLHERLRRHGQVLLARSRAYDRLSALAEVLAPTCQVADVLAAAAQAVLDLDGDGGQGEAVAYSIDEDRGEVLAVRWRSSGPPLWRSLPLPARALGLPAGSGGAADEAMAWLPGNGVLKDLGDLAGWVHQPFRCGGRWVGGLLQPPGRAGEAGKLLAGSLGMTLGLIQQRCRAEALCEELAAASRRLAETQEALAEARILAAMGDLAAGAAHELNNPLAVVSGRAQLMRERSRSEVQKRTWQTIAEQAQRISDVISDLMEFASPPEPRPAEIDPRELLAGAAEAFSASDHPKARSARVDIDTGANCPAIRADRGQAQAVIVELLTNAATAGGPAPRIRLAAQADELVGAVLLTVRDDGPGMDEATMARAFTPFFSAQPAGRRRGLGLPRAKRYVENNGGRIWIDSKPGLGTAVSIQLPAAAGPAARKQEHAHK